MNLNPLDLRGPEFLFFYVCATGLVGVIARVLLHRLERKSLTVTSARLARLAQDPYAVACLRGGKRELLMVSLVSLLERGLIEVTDRKLLYARPDALAQVRRPLDKALLSRLPLAGARAPDGQKAALPEVSAEQLLNDDLVTQESELVRRQLPQAGFPSDESIETDRLVLIWGPVLVLWTLAFVKIQIALSRGHSNVLFLFFLALAVPFVFYQLIPSLRDRQTAAAVAQVQDWYGKLYDQRRSLRLAATTSELTYLAAVYGYDALPDAVCEILAPLPSAKPKPVWHQPDTSGGTLGGSSCGGGSSCSGGSSCGGGGGCGGCGGS